MSAVASKPSPISRLLALLSQPQHPYRPTTEIFLDLNVDRVADSLQLAKYGRERGSENRPPQESETLDDVEHQIIERVQTHKQDANSLYLEHLHTYDTRLAALNFEERFSNSQRSSDRWTKHAKQMPAA